MNYYIVPGLKNRQIIGMEQQDKSDTIFKTVCKFSGVTEEDLKGKCRKEKIVIARFIAFYLIKQNTSMALVDIGKIFDRDHTTIIHGIKTIKDRMRFEPDIMEKVQKLEAII